MGRQEWIDELTACAEADSELRLTVADCRELAEMLKEEVNANES